MITNELTLVYTGSLVEATYLQDLLQEQKIGCMLRDSLGESVIAGWGQGSPEDAVRIWVSNEHADEAKLLIANWFENR